MNPSLGEHIAVIGLGMVGLLCVQMLLANGCRVLAIDNNSQRCKLAQQFGAEIAVSGQHDIFAVGQQFSQGQGLDGVLIATASDDNEIIHQATEICRKRGRIILIGTAGLNLRRDDFFKKELTFQVSASYGPGRYDSDYEQRGQDYPQSFVRWTVQRNFDAVLQLMASGRLNVKPLITHRYSINEAITAFQQLNDKSALGILLNYPKQPSNELRISQFALDATKTKSPKNNAQVHVGFIGAGNYASRTLIPAFQKNGAHLDTLVSSGGVSAYHHGKKFAFKQIASTEQAIWEQPEINAVAIATRHHQHAEQVIAALQAGKHVFVEKPLALTLDELHLIDKTYRKQQQILMVGFNRRFASLAIKLKTLLALRSEAESVVMTINAGSVPADHWTQNKTIGGGRLIGEACHFIDLLRFIIGHPITGFYATAMPTISSRGNPDTFTFTLNFSNGSIGTVHYFANGNKAFPKERVEVFCGGAVLQLDNYRVLRGFGWNDFKRKGLWYQDKGQNTCTRAFIQAIVNGKPSPIPYNEIMECAQTTIEIANSLKNTHENSVSY